MFNKSFGWGLRGCSIAAALLLCAAPALGTDYTETADFSATLGGATLLSPGLTVGPNTVTGHYGVDDTDVFRVTLGPTMVITSMSITVTNGTFPPSTRARIAADQLADGGAVDGSDFFSSNGTYTIAVPSPFLPGTSVRFRIDGNTGPEFDYVVTITAAFMACCHNASGACSISDASGCPANSSPVGTTTTCSPSPCAYCEVVNGGFETGDFTGWTQFGNLSQGVNSARPHTGTFSAFFQAVGSTGGIAQTVPVGAGTTVAITFWLYNQLGGTNSFLAEFDGQTLVSLTDAPAFGFTQYTFVRIVTGANPVLRFTARHDPAFFHLDDVSVCLTTTACCNSNSGVCGIVGINATCPAGTTPASPVSNTCAPNPCPQPRACCDALSGACTLVATCPPGSAPSVPGAAACSPGVCVPHCATLPSFVGGGTYGTGDDPRAVAVADYNGDGIQDLAVANNDSGNVSILRGAAGGTFLAAVNYPTDLGPMALAAGDFDGVGGPDLAVVNTDASNMSILLNNGNGTFPAPVNYAFGTFPTSVAAADLNGDSVLDLAVTLFTDQVAILLGNGNGTFQAPVLYGTGSRPFDLAVGDFNGDAKPDLAVANNSGGNVSILLGNGNGTFQAAVNYGSGTQPIAIAVGDFNGDSRLDLVVAHFTGSNFAILLGNGNGTFAAPLSTSAGALVRDVAVGDFDGDGRNDLVVDVSGGGRIWIVLGNGDGTFQAPTVIFAGGPWNVAIANFDGAGGPDVAVTDINGDRVFIFLSVCPGACCNTTDGSCALSASTACAGNYRGDGVACAPGVCPQPLACCDITSGACTVVAPGMMGAVCGVGTVASAGNSSTCTAGLCPQPLACCNTTSGACTVAPPGTAGAVCGAGTVASTGNSSTCTVGLCPQPLACCDTTTGACTVVPPGIGGAACGAGTVASAGNSSTCTVGLCPQPLACCDTTSGACTVVPPGVGGAVCGVGTVAAPGNAATCTPGLCPQPIACCNFITGVCVVAPPGAACAAGSAAAGATSCVPYPCPLIGSVGLACPDCTWVNGAFDGVSGQDSHLGGAIPLGAKAADDFFLCEDFVYDLQVISATLMTTTDPLWVKPIAEIYEDCNGCPGALLYRLDSALVVETGLTHSLAAPDGRPLRIIHASWSIDASQQIVNNRNIVLKGGRYWLSVYGRTDNFSLMTPPMYDVTYWGTTGNGALGVKGLPAKKINGQPTPVYNQFLFGAGCVSRGGAGPGWKSVTDGCCIGCTDLNFSVCTRPCKILIDNGPARNLPGVALGSTSQYAIGSNSPLETRSADDFVIPPCQAYTICYVEACILTNCPTFEGVFELYTNDCHKPSYTLHGIPFGGNTSVATKVIDLGFVWTVGTAMYRAYKLEFHDLAIVVPGGTQMWISAGVRYTFSLTERAFFCYNEPCAACDIKWNPGRVLTVSSLDLDPPPVGQQPRLGWAALVDDFSFLIAADGNSTAGPINADPPPAPSCAADLNRDGVLNVTDIFDYLTGWFSGCP